MRWYTYLGPYPCWKHDSCHKAFNHQMTFGTPCEVEGRGLRMDGLCPGSSCTKNLTLQRQVHRGADDVDRKKNGWPLIAMGWQAQWEVASVNWQSSMRNEMSLKISTKSYRGVISETSTEWRRVLMRRMERLIVLSTSSRYLRSNVRPNWDRKLAQIIGVLALAWMSTHCKRRQIPKSRVSRREPMGALVLLDACNLISVSFGR